ncbi:16S rRNA (guanine(527)-N(7))-methyltransferase RsmG [Phaeobacter sp. B1627]|uniref:16S rRNA (guanine(527)-N(7))-methyltransferase RsmG n=1 Tax=Phaeobacter sp. B1627 TaxID=2583809 RepID=UPI001119135C|nr:16S rRNA (guanine(527)-N(7))-methyltransferase RsmG [Phaeobacter sp. B1627]TNJ45529.1 16S rRNA (guanine(527)-N(7))-methyltransferase RsmG [Phaeobacter sp. B1627]
MTRDIIRSKFDVSRETMEKLDIFVENLRKWNPRINLVSKRSMEDLWTRHVLDSVQVYHAAPSTDTWMDIGSGGGFPGLICAILAADTAKATHVTLVESDQRKCAFLRAAARECEVSVTVKSERVEALEPAGAGVLSARALADLAHLFTFAERHLAVGGTSMFPKGVTWKKEVDRARQQWRFDYEAIKSLTEPEAVILKIKGLERA